MSYAETIGYLYSLQKFGIKFGLDNITKLCHALGNPRKSFRSIHIAGTNGKGSTSAIIASILQSAGLRTGLFTSPHLISFTERIRVDGTEISEEDVIALTEEIREASAGFNDFHPTFFEAVTAIAFLYFQRRNTDIAVIETGMGGRLDSTNIISPEVSVITPVSYDHKEFLGNTLAEIANEKAGIIKQGVPVVIALQEQEAMEVLSEKAREKTAGTWLYGRDFHGILRKADTSGICFDYYEDGALKITDLFLPLAGEYQMQNASVAIRAATLFINSPCHCASVSPYHNDTISDYIKNGLASVRWPGRLEFINRNPDVLIDGAHNPAAASVLAENLKNIFLKKYKKIIMILGIMNDKDIKGIMEPLLAAASDIIMTAPAYDRAASPSRLSETAASIGFENTYISETVKAALEKAFSISSNDSLIVVTGSFYTIGETKEALGQKGVLTRLREC